MFVERLGSYHCDIFARTAVLAMGIGPCFYGFSIEKQLFWPISCTCLTKRGFKMITDLDRNILKQEEEEEERRIQTVRWRNGHILLYVKNHETCAFHLNN